MPEIQYSLTMADKILVSKIHRAIGKIVQENSMRDSGSYSAATLEQTAASIVVRLIAGGVTHKAIEKLVCVGQAEDAD